MTMAYELMMPAIAVEFELGNSLYLRQDTNYDARRDRTLIASSTLHHNYHHILAINY